MLGMEDTHKRSHIATVVIATVVFIVTSILTFIGYGPLANARQGVFTNNTADIYKTYHTSLTPADWTYFVVWIAIFVWLLITFGYSFSTLYRYTSYGYLYIAPGHVRWTLYALLCFAMVLHICWLFVMDTGNLAWSFIMALGTTATLFMTLVMTLRKMFTRGLILKREEAVLEIWLCRMTLHNALDLYATWFLYLTLLSLNAVLVYGFGVARHLAGVGIMGFLLVIVVLFFCLDVFVLDKYTRYAFVGYVGFIVALSGSVTNNFDADSSVTIISTLTLVIACIGLVLKIATAILRHNREPIWIGSTMFLTNRTYGTLDERQKSGSHNLTYSSELI